MKNEEGLKNEDNLYMKMTSKKGDLKKLLVVVELVPKQSFKPLKPVIVANGSLGMQIAASMVWQTYKKSVYFRNPALEFS